jgi:hypothetical protein
MQRQYLTAAPILIACLASAWDIGDPFATAPAAAPAATPAGGKAPAAPAAPGVPADFTKVLEDNMLSLINDPNHQLTVAALAFVLGAFALVDGARFFRSVVTIMFGLTFFIIALSQLKNNDWTGENAGQKRLFAAAEVGIFFAMIAHRGWEGVQLVIGLLLGIYVADLIQDFAKVIGKEQAASQTGPTLLIYTVGVLIGTLGVNDRFGARKTFGILAPLFGSSLIVAAMGHYASTVGNMAMANPPSVFSVWWMIVRPTHFLPGDKIPLHTRLVGTAMCAFFFLAGMCGQLKSKKVSAKEGLTETLLDDKEDSQQLPK